MYIRNREPSVDEVLSDPVIQLVMARAGLSDEAMRSLIAEAKRRLEGDGAAGAKSAEVAETGERRR